MYDRTTVQGASFNMRGQLYRGHANATEGTQCLLLEGGNKVNLRCAELQTSFIT